MTSAVHRHRLLLLPVAVLTAVGCYDAEALRKGREEANALSRLEEIDLGSFRVTLPHVLGDATDSVVDFHAFGQVARRDRGLIDNALETREPELRSQMLLALRGMPETSFEEPKLTALRRQIVEVINGSLDKKAVKQVGFYYFTFDKVE